MQLKVEGQNTPIAKACLQPDLFSDRFLVQSAQGYAGWHLEAFMRLGCGGAALSGSFAECTTSQRGDTDSSAAQYNAVSRLPLNLRRQPDFDDFSDLVGATKTIWCPCLLESRCASIVGEHAQFASKALASDKVHSYRCKPPGGMRSSSLSASAQCVYYYSSSESLFVQQL